MTPTYEMVKLWFTPERAARFWSKVDKQPGLYGCWLWMGALTDTGHGRIRFEGEDVRVHRLMWILARECDLPEYLTINDHGLPYSQAVPLVIRHFMCENKPCCNPAHLVGGTQGENVYDIWMVQRPYKQEQERLARLVYRETPFNGYFTGECL